MLFTENFLPNFFQEMLKKSRKTQSGVQLAVNERSVLLNMSLVK